MSSNTTLRRPLHRAAAAASAGSMLLLSACATAPQPGTQVVDAPNDTCAVHRAAFRDLTSSFDLGQAVTTSLAVGAVAGLAAGLAGGARAGAIVGASVAGAGIVASLIKDDFEKKQAEEKRQALLQQTELVNRFGERVTGGQVALDRLTACRREQVQTVRAEYRAKRMPREEAEQRIANYRKWYEGDLVLVRAFDARLADDSKQLADSSRYITPGGIEPEQTFRPYAGIIAVEGPVRRAPEDAAGEVTTLQSGQRVQVTGKEGAWLRLALPNRQSGYVRTTQVARETTSKDFKGKSAQPIRTAARDESRELGAVATGNPYKVVGNMPGWLVVDQGARRSFVRATALEPGRVDESGREVVQAAASAVSARDAFASSTTTLAADAQRVSLDG